MCCCTNTARGTFKSFITLRSIMRVVETMLFFSSSRSDEVSLTWLGEPLVVNEPEFRNIGMNLASDHHTSSRNLPELISDRLT